MRDKIDSDKTTGREKEAFDIRLELILQTPIAWPAFHGVLPKKTNAEQPRLSNMISHQRVFQTRVTEWRTDMRSDGQTLL